MVTWLLSEPSCLSPADEMFVVHHREVEWPRAQVIIVSYVASSIAVLHTMIDFDAVLVADIPNKYHIFLCAC